MFGKSEYPYDKMIDGTAYIRVFAPEIEVGDINPWNEKVTELGTYGDETIKVTYDDLRDEYLNRTSTRLVRGVYV